MKMSLISIIGRLVLISVERDEVWLRRDIVGYGRL